MRSPPLAFALGLALLAGCASPPPLEAQVGLMRHGEHAAVGLWLDPPEAWRTTNTAAPEVLLWVEAAPTEGRVVRVQTRGPNEWRVYWGGSPGFTLDLDVTQAIYRGVRLNVIHGQLQPAESSAPAEVLAEQRKRRELGPLPDGGSGPGNLPRILTIRLNTDGSYDFSSAAGVSGDLLQDR